MIPDQAWRAQAKCRYLDPELFFPHRGAGLDRPAKNVCRQCPVALQCLEYALEFGEEGVWGGTTEPERRRIRANRRLRVVA